MATHQSKPSWISLQFSKFAQATASYTGHPVAFLLAVAVVVVWIVTGPIFDYSDTWQLVINTGTTIVTFLMVFLIQNTQNRDILTVQLKLSELVLAMKGAENRFAAIEDLTDEELEELHNECRARAEETLEHIAQRKGHDKKEKKEEEKEKASHKTAAARAKSPSKRSPPSRRTH